MQNKQQLLEQLQLKKQHLKQIQEKCELQNKKIKLYRKQNEQLQSKIEDINQSDTNLLLSSKQLLTANTKIENIIEELKQELQRVKTIGNNKKVQLQAQNSNITTSEQAHSNSVPVLTMVSIRESTITQSTIEVDMPNCQLVDEQFLQLQSFSQLKSLTVNDNLLTNTSVIMICQKLTNLQKLNLANNKFDSTAIKEIHCLKNLITLDVRNNNLGDQAIIYISKLVKLTDLSCSKNNITDKSLTNLQNLSHLTYLDITNNLITSESIGSFIKLQKLTHLYLMSNRLDKQGIILLLKSSKSLQFLDVRFNVWNNEDKEQIRANKPQNVEVFC